MSKDTAFKFIGPNMLARANKQIQALPLSQSSDKYRSANDRTPSYGDEAPVHMNAPVSPGPRSPNKPANSQTGNNSEANPRKALVIVRQGNKRVAAAKSRPKKRKAVTPDDGSTLSMDSVEWSSVTYSVTALARQFGGSFPRIVKVTLPHMGVIGAPLEVGQVLQIHCAGRQQRVLITDNQGRQLSMPVDYPMEVNILEQNDRVWMKLRDVILSRTLPLKARVMKTMTHLHGDPVDGGRAGKSLEGQDITINSLREYLFLRANYINDGWLDQTDVLHIPAYSEAHFVIAENMRGASVDEWYDYSGMYSRSVRHLDFTLLSGYTVIAENMRWASVEDWYDYSGMYSRSVRHLDFALFSGYTGIYLEGLPPIPLPDEYSSLDTTRSSAGPSRQHTLTLAPHCPEDRATDLYMNIPSGERKGTSRGTIPSAVSIMPHEYEDLDVDAIQNVQSANVYAKVNKETKVAASKPTEKEISVEKGKNSNRNSFDNHTFSLHDEENDSKKVQAQIDIIPHFSNHESYQNSQETGKTSTYDNAKKFQRSNKDKTPDIFINSTTPNRPRSQSSPRPISRPDTPFSDGDEDGLDTMFDSVIQVGRETLEKQRRLEAEGGTTSEFRLQPEVAAKCLEESLLEAENKRKLRVMENTGNGAETATGNSRETTARNESFREADDMTWRQHRVQEETEDQMRLRKESEERERIARDALERRERQESKRRSQMQQEQFVLSPGLSISILPPPPTYQVAIKGPPQSSVPSISEQVQLGYDKAQCSSHIEVKKDISSSDNRVRRHSSLKDEVFVDNKAGKAHSVLSILNKFESSSNKDEENRQRGSRPVSRSGSRSGTSGAPLRTPGSGGVSSTTGTPVGVIQPTILQRKESLKENVSRGLTTRDNNNKHGGDLDLNSSSIKTMDDVPDKTSKLTVSDVCQCLKLLNMDVHIPEFWKSQVDGTSLEEMKETSLVNDFHVSPFNASKLMRFSRGWRPKFT